MYQKSPILFSYEKQKFQAIILLVSFLFVSFIIYSLILQYQFYQDFNSLFGILVFGLLAIYVSIFAFVTTVGSVPP